MKKTDVYVVVDTPKKAKKLKKVLDMFGENHTGESIGYGCYDGVKLFDDTWCAIRNEIEVDNEVKVSIKELRNILAKEHLKAGDVVFMRPFKGKYESILKIKGVKGDYLEVDKELFVKGSDYIYSDGKELIEDFIRYATEEEKALLEPRKELGVGKWYKGVWERPTSNFTNSDIAIVERLHDTLLDNHGYLLGSKLLTDARLLASKIKSNIK